MLDTIIVGLCIAGLLGLIIWSNPGGFALSFGKAIAGEIFKALLPQIAPMAEDKQKAWIKFQRENPAGRRIDFDRQWNRRSK